MNMLMSNFPILLAALSLPFVATAAGAADTPVTGQVTVQAERPVEKVVGRSASGVPIVLVELRHRVSYSDLELSIPSNAKVLKTRVHDAARGVCTDLERLYSVSSDSADCARKAEADAMPQVDAAIAAAQARKNAAAN